MLLVSTTTLAKLSYTSLVENQPQLIQTSNATNSYIYFRVYPTLTDKTKQYFETRFSSCVGRVEVYYSKCDFQSDPTCDDQSEKWFPNEQNNQGKLVHSGHMQQVQNTFSTNEICKGHCYAKTGNNSQVVYFYGVKVISTNADGYASIEAWLKYYENAPGYKYDWSGMGMVMVEGMMFMWPKPWYCAKENATGFCEQKVVADNMEFTIYSLYKQDKSPLYSDPSINMGTLCGIDYAKAVQFDDPTTETMVHYMPMDKLGEAFITLVGRDQDPNVWPMIYMPFHYNMTKMPEPNRKVLQIVLVSVASSVAGIMIIAGIVAIAVYAYSRFAENSKYEYL